VSESTAKQVLAIIPCHNEVGSIGDLVTDLFTYGVSRIIVSVDPLCTDETASVASFAGATVVHGTSSGYDGPVLAGLEAGAGFDGWVLFLDAGRKYEIESIGALIKAADPAAEMTFGIRDQQQFWHQRLGNNLFKIALWLRFQRHWANDISSVRLIRTDAVPRLRLEDRKFSLPFQTLVHGLKFGMRIDYVPIRCTQVRVGTSKVSGSPVNSARAAIQMLLSIWKAPD
jgi:hypothetical protein